MRRNSRKIRVLQVVEEMSPGGTETWLLNVLRKLDRERFAIDFLVHTGRECAYDADIRALGAQIHRCTCPRRPLQYGRALRSLLTAVPGYDVIHSHIHHYSGLVLSIAAGQVPLRIAHSHTTADARAKDALSVGRKLYLLAMKRAIRRYANVRLAASRDAAEALFGSGWTNDPACSVLTCGIPVNGGEPGTAGLRSELGLPRGARVIGHVGRFETPKNHEFLLTVAQEIVRREPRAHFLLVGEGSLRHKFETAVAAHGLTSKFTLLGNRRDVPALLTAAMDCFLFPSLYEGLGLALVEAQAAGLPCIFTNTIPQEAGIVQSLCERLPLDAGPGLWSSRVLARLGTPRMSLAEAHAALNRSGLTIEHSVKQLEKVYAGHA